MVPQSQKGAAMRIRTAYHFAVTSRANGEYLRATAQLAMFLLLAGYTQHEVRNMVGAL